MTQPGVPYRPARATPPAVRAETRRDIDAALAARMELGQEYEEHIAAGLADRIEELVAYRTAELRHQSQSSDVVAQAEASARRQRFVLGIVSLGAGIPISGIAATTVDPGLLGLAVAWAGIVAVNAAHGIFNRPRQR